MDMKELEYLFSKAYWLSAIQRKLFSSIFSKHSYVDWRLAALLCSILYAEAQLKKQKKGLRCLEMVLEYLGIDHYFCRTIGIWNFHIRHADRFQLSKKEFIKILNDPVLSTHIVIDFLIEEIGLDKPNELIFAEYNYGCKTTSMICLQRVFNILLKERTIIEDGYYGKQTELIFQKYSHFFPDGFLFQELNDKKIFKALCYIKKNYNIEASPFVPPIKKKRFLYRDIDVPRYVSWAMHAYESLEYV